MTNVKENYFQTNIWIKQGWKKHGHYKASQMAISLCPIEHDLFFFTKKPEDIQC
jgi:hypothetical protein